MTRSDPLCDYLDLAHKLLSAIVSERDLPEITSQLPTLNENILDKVAQHAEEAALSQPRRGWAFLQIANEAANSQSCNPFLRSMAAWYLGRAYNHWTRPKQVAEAIGRARDGFVKLNMPGWIAACDWQSNALPWTKTSFLQAAHTLEQALEGLKQASFESLIPHCRLALSYAQILIGEFKQAEVNILASEEAFSRQGDLINQARCWLNRVSYLRRLARFDEALCELDRILRTFTNQNAPLDTAKAHYQIALVHLARIDVPVAISHLETAAKIFAERDLDLWQAACATNLGAIYMQNGQLAKAEGLYQQARQSFIRHDVVGMLADNLNDNGKLNALRGLPYISMEQFKQSEEINKRLGAQLSAAVAVANMGETYGQLGRYQNALYHLERAIECLEPLKNFHHLGTCEKYIAQIWSQLRQPSLAHDHLDKAAIYYEETKQKSLLSSIYNTRASIFFEQGEPTKALDCLEKSLEIADAYGIKPQAALARRLLGEAFLRTGCYEQAQSHLERARQDFSEIGMVMEHAASIIAQGTCYARMSKFRKAKNALLKALSLSEGAFPELDWRTYVELAALAESDADINAAIDYYRLGEEALSKVRLNFWQPSLVGSYLQTPSAVFSKAVTLTVKTNACQDALQFIEANKATTLLRQLSAVRAPARDEEHQDINNIRAEINWLQEQLRASLDKTIPVQFAFRQRQIHSQLIEKIKIFDSLMSRIERRTPSDSAPQLLPHKFDPSPFRAIAKQILGDLWVALDYYLVENQLVIVEITPEHIQLFSSPIPHRIHMALEECIKARNGFARLLWSDLDILGNWLVPASTVKLLTPDTYLILAPHKELHGIPWPAIRPGDEKQPLVSLCIPHIVPSFSNLASLWERDLAGPSQNRTNGILIGISHFQSRHRDIPLVKGEVNALGERLGAGGKLLFDSQASWDNIRAMKDAEHSPHQAHGLSRFSWLHIASHMFSDPRTGRLSGIALWDRDIWLDQLRDLAPLPSLITFSACNGISSFVYEGDEHVGAPTTCLIAGASSVIGSVWPVIDQAAAKFMVDFYDHYLVGMHPAQAAAKTQRQMIEQGEDLKAWAGFVCMGAP